METFEGTGIKNLKLRGGIYYWRQKIGSVQYSESLQTSDKADAVKRMGEKVKAVKSGEFIKEKKMTKQQDTSAG